MGVRDGLDRSSQRLEVITHSVDDVIFVEQGRIIAGGFRAGRG
jgi:hypothetical protein